MQNESQLFYIFLGIALILWGVSVVIPERALVVIAAGAAIIAGVLTFVLAL